MTKTLVQYLLEGTRGSDVTKTDQFLDAIMFEAAGRITQLEAQVERLSSERKIKNAGSVG